MDKIEDGGPAFPRAGRDSKYPSSVVTPEDGMSLRDYFAAKAMAAIIHGENPHKIGVHWISNAAYSVADAMLKERAK